MPLGSSQLLRNKVEDMVEVVRLRHSVVVGPIWHLLPYFLLCPTDGIQLLHVLWSKTYERMLSTWRTEMRLSKLNLRYDLIFQPANEKDRNAGYSRKSCLAGPILMAEGSNEFCWWENASRTLATPMPRSIE